jgi:hypothetical protein
MNNKGKVHENCVYAKRKVVDLRAEAQWHIETGQMPTLNEVLEAVAEARRKYADKIIAARKESKQRGLRCKR